MKIDLIYYKVVVVSSGYGENQNPPRKSVLHLPFLLRSISYFYHAPCPMLHAPLYKNDITGLDIIEIEKRRADAQRLPQEAETEWEAAKTRFEGQLLEEATP